MITHGLLIHKAGDFIRWIEWHHEVTNIHRTVTFCLGQLPRQKIYSLPSLALL